jgi:hypothetical protein
VRRGGWSVVLLNVPRSLNPIDAFKPSHPVTKLLHNFLHVHPSCFNRSVEAICSTLDVSLSDDNLHRNEEGHENNTTTGKEWPLAKLKGGLDVAGNHRSTEKDSDAVRSSID